MNNQQKTYRVDLGLCPYQEAWDLMRQVVDSKIEQKLPDIIFFLEHPPVYTLGKRGNRDNILVDESLLANRGAQLFHVERGGDVTWHGPGQLVVYPVLDLGRRNLLVGDLVRKLERAVVSALDHFQIEAEASPDRIGIWTNGKKIASIGMAVRRGITFHGVALNVCPDLSYFDMIVPCGLKGFSMTSMDACLGGASGLPEVREVLADRIARELGVELEKLEARSIKTVVPSNTSGVESYESGGAGPPPDSQQTTPSPEPPRKPDWLKKRLSSHENIGRVAGIIRDKNLHTVCREAHCPNQGECYAGGTATFMILGAQCTRNCRFCAVETGQPLPPDPDEPENIAQAVNELALDYAVITSVTRDDLPDGGSAHFAETIQRVRRRNPSTLIEVLIPDFGGDLESLKTVLQARPDVLNHNVETVARIYKAVRPQAIYERSLKTLSRVYDLTPDIVIKTGFMVGLGETDSEVLELLCDLKETRCNMITIGQYLQPSADHFPVQAYVEPAVFERYRILAMDLGFHAVASGPYVRSSYQAKEMFYAVKNSRRSS